jgi:hypothetical protein
MVNFSRVAWLCILFCFSGQVLAQDISGFITIGAGEVKPRKEGNAGGVAYQAAYNDYNKDFQFESLSLAGLQISQDIDESSSVTLQFLAKGNKKFAPEVAWAYYKRRIGNNRDLLLGRFSSPFYISSASINVGYSYQWIKPPIEAHRVPIESITGAKLTQRLSLPVGHLNAEMYYGTGEEKSLRAHTMKGATITYSYDWLTLRAMKSVWDMSWLYHPIFGPTTPVTGGQRVDYDFESAGATFDFQNLFIQSEFMTLDAVNFTDIGFGYDAYYVMLGYRFGSITPSITYTDYLRSVDEEFYPEFNEFRRASFEENSLKIGLRWDMPSGPALKFEYTDANAKNIVPPPGRRFPELDVAVYAISLDVTF